MRVLLRDACRFVVAKPTSHQSQAITLGARKFLRSGRCRQLQPSRIPMPNCSQRQLRLLEPWQSSAEASVAARYTHHSPDALPLVGELALGSPHRAHSNRHPNKSLAPHQSQPRHDHWHSPQSLEKSQSVRPTLNGRLRFSLLAG